MSSPQRPKVLILTGQSLSLAEMRSFLEPLRVTVTGAESTAELFALLQRQEFVAVLLELHSPSADHGLETARQIRKETRRDSQPIPLLFVGKFNSNDPGITEVESLSAVDFLSLPLLPAMLRARISFYLESDRRGRSPDFRGETGNSSPGVSEPAPEQVLIDSVSPLLWTNGADGSTLSFNRRWVEYTGVDVSHSVGLQWSQLLHPDDVPALITTRNQNIRQGTAYELECRVKRKDGAFRWHLVRVRPLKGPDGRPLSWFGSATDIHELKETQQALEESRRRYQWLIENTSEAVWRFELDQPLSTLLSEQEQIEHCFREAYLAECNECMARMYGFKQASDMVGIRLAEMMPPQEEKNRQMLQAFIRSGYRLLDAETVECDKEGRPKYFLNNLVAEVENNQVRLAWGSSRDITERKNAELALAQLNQELENRVRQRTAELQDTNQQMETFIYTVAHDLRAPLRAMKGFSQALIEDYETKLDASGRDYISRIKDSAQRMDRLLEDLLQYSRVSRAGLEIQPVDLNQVVAQVLSVFARQIESAQAEVQVQPQLPWVLGHPATLENVLGNLVSNALKFIPPEARSQVSIEASLKAGRTRISVRDNGIGVQPEHLSRIFRIFERLHPTEKYPGTGMGLAIVQKAIERMGGTVGVSSVPGQGSCFWIELPLAEIPD